MLWGNAGGFREMGSLWGILTPTDWAGTEQMEKRVS